MCTVDVMQVDVDAMGIRLMHVSECRETYCLHLTMCASAIRFFILILSLKHGKGVVAVALESIPTLVRSFHECITRNVLKFRWRCTETLNIH